MLLPCSSTTSAATPGRGSVHEPGLVATTPGLGVFLCVLVSVCHQVSTTGQRSRPITRWYHIHALGLMGSPTVPSRRSFDKSYCAGMVSPCFMSARIAVGAV